MNINSHEKESILEAISYSIDNPEYELECLFNNSPTPFRPNIKHDNFISIIKRFKGRPDFEASENVRLAISFPPTSKYNSVRVLIKGNGPINNYCNNENINLIRNNVDFEDKSRVKHNNTNNKNSSININNYNIKFNLKREQNFNNDDARISELLRDWSTETKDYRYKKIFSFEKKTKDFVVDVSIVKSNTLIENRYITVKEVYDNNLLKSVLKPYDVKEPFPVWWKSIQDKPNEKVKVKGGSNYYKNIKESEVFTNIPTYEAEVEYIKNKIFTKPKFKNITERKEYIQSEYINFFRQIGSILQCIQGSLYIISRDEEIEVKDKFIKVVENSITETMLHNHGVGSESDSNDMKAKRKGDDNGERKKKIINFKHKNYQKGGAITSNTLDSDNELQYDTEEDTSSDKVVEDITNDEDDSDTVNDNDNTDNSLTQRRELEGTLVPSQQDLENPVRKGGSSREPWVPSQSQEGGSRKIARIKYEITESLRKYGVFFGPMIIDLSHNNSQPINPEAIPDIKTNTNIHINYLVTDKTDGDRKLLFFDEKGKTYGVDRENNIKSYGVTIPILANSILDGEHVTRSEDDKILNNFYIFDAYIYKGENVIIKPFNFSKSGKIDGRHKYIIDAAKLSNEGTNIQLNEKLPFRIFKKDYYPSNSPDTYAKLTEADIPLISENCNFLLNKMNVKYGGYLEEGHMFSYKTDGLVFLPNNLSVYQKYEDDYESIKNPFKINTWRNNYKWKPVDHLTIDFKIEFVKDMATGRLEYKYFNSNKKYLKVNLISLVRQVKDPKSTINNKLNIYLLNSGNKIQSIPEDFKFFATNPFIGSYDDEGNLENNMGEAYFEVDLNDNILCKNGNFITNGVICECSYNKKNKNKNSNSNSNSNSVDEKFCWEPERVRADKTSPNIYNTAVAAWELINNPITKDKLSGIKKIKTMYTEGINNGLSDRINDGITTDIIEDTNLENITYYSSNTKTEYVTNPFKELANFVKRYIINKALTGYIKAKVLDLAVGQLGDLDKYARAGVHTLIGIDINEDNINNLAPTRIMDLSKHAPAIAKLAEKTMLIIGTGTKNIANGESVRDNINRYYIDILYGRAKGNTPKLRKMEGVGLDKFDMVSCMYAIHYMMNSEYDLDNFLRNVSENLLDQGYFIGTCLNGDAILSEMGSKMEIKGVIDGKTVFLIKKKSDDPKDYKTISVGNKINVFFETFGGAFDENLVSIQYLKERAKSHSLKLVDYKSFLEEPGNLLSMYEGSDESWLKNAKSNAQTIRNSNAMSTWTKFNCYFIFQKVRKVE